MIKYIKSTEEFIDVLTQGKVVYLIEDKTVSFKMVKGQVCAYYTNGRVELCPDIRFGGPQKDGVYSFYYLEDIPFEVGKFYMCKDGVKSLCAYIEKTDKGETLITMVRQDNGYIYCANAQGLTYDGFEYSEQSCFSVVAPWPKECKNDSTH